MLSNLDVMLTNVNPDLKAILLDENAPDFNGLRQSFNEIQRAIYAKDIDAIQKDGLTYNLVQAIQRGDCDVYQAADVLLFYMWMTKIEKYREEHQIQADWRDLFKFVKQDGIVDIVGRYRHPYLTFGDGVDSLLESQNKAVLEDDIAPRFRQKRQSFLSQKGSFSLLSLQRLNKDRHPWHTEAVEGFPVLHGFNADVLAQGLFGKKPRRYITFPKYLPKSLKDKFAGQAGVKNLYQVHEGVFEGYLCVALHDLLHLTVEMDIHGEYALRQHMYHHIQDLLEATTMDTAEQAELQLLADEIADEGLVTTLHMQKAREPASPFSIHSDLKKLAPDTRMAILVEIFLHEAYEQLDLRWFEDVEESYFVDFYMDVLCDLSTYLNKRQQAQLVDIQHRMHKEDYTFKERVVILLTIYSYVSERDEQILADLKSFLREKQQDSFSIYSFFGFKSHDVQTQLMQWCVALIDMPANQIAACSPNRLDH